jgi:hypothetical protein
MPAHSRCLISAAGSKSGRINCYSNLALTIEFQDANVSRHGNLWLRNLFCWVICMYVPCTCPGMCLYSTDEQPKKLKTTPTVTRRWQSEHKALCGFLWFAQTFMERKAALVFVLFCGNKSSLCSPGWPLTWYSPTSVSPPKCWDYRYVPPCSTQHWSLSEESKIQNLEWEPILEGRKASVHEHICTGICRCLNFF